MEFLQDYESSDEESENSKLETPDATALASVKLALPSSISNMFPQEQHQDDPMLHQGRSRTFEHERGMWAGHVSIEVGEMFEEWAALLTEDLQKCPTPLHISLSRPLQLRHHWIEPLLCELRKRAAKIPPFQVFFGSSLVLMNDEATRTFLAVEALGSGGSLEAACAASDAAASSFRLPSFYSERRFHVSVAWTHGDQRSRFEAIPPPSPVEPLLVRRLTLSAGHLNYSVPLAAS